MIKDLYNQNRTLVRGLAYGAAVLLVTLALHVVVNKKVAKEYAATIQDHELMSALEKGTPDEASASLSSRHIAYRRIEGYKVAFDSQPNLPPVTIVPMQRTVAAAVLPVDSMAAISQQQAYTSLSTNGLYVITPLFSQTIMETAIFFILEYYE